jgi:actin-related protein
LSSASSNKKERKRRREVTDGVVLSGGKVLVEAFDRQLFRRLVGLSPQKNMM